MKRSLIVIMGLLLFAALFSTEGQTESYESYQIFVEPDFLSLTFYTMLVDPGHGGGEPGNIGRVYGLLEKDVNLGVGLMAYGRLVSWYWWPIMTRTGAMNVNQLHRANIDKNGCKILENNLGWWKAIIQI